jgi:Secretion system C-terminal sorting domain
MKKYVILSVCFLLASFSLKAQFAPPAGVPGTSAIYKDSSVFTSWATGCSIVRGPQDISNTALGVATTGDSSMALGIAGSNGIVSLGDGGQATLTFAQPITNGPGWDFAVFENSFDGFFLELAFVEVSSDGINFVRFPAISTTQDTVQVGGFGQLDATKLNNLAGKYIALYGTPFDLNELVGSPGLDINSITHVRVVDVVGCIQPAFASYDANNNPVNDPWNTPFGSSGFDLDAVGVINFSTSIAPSDFISSLAVYPVPLINTGKVSFTLKAPADLKIEILTLAGQTLQCTSLTNQLPGNHEYLIDAGELSAGCYLLAITSSNSSNYIKIIIQ